MKFTGIVKTFGENSLMWETHIPIPDTIYNKMVLLAKDKRIICTLNNSITIHCAMIPKGTFHYILLNKELFKKLKLELNTEIQVEIVEDKSKYGMSISEEFEEVLFSDPQGSLFFHKLTPGKQRTLIHLVNKVKNSQSRIEKSFVIVDHLKKGKGILDYKLLDEDFKNFKKQQKL